MGKTALTATLLFLCQTFSEGFDFTLQTDVSDSSGISTARQVCGVLLCTDSITGTSTDQGNYSRKLASITVYKHRMDGNVVGGRWQDLASVTSQKPNLNRVSDGVQVSGQITDLNAQLSLELTKTHDCQESQFSCVAVSTNSQGQRSVKKSLLGKSVDSLPDFGPQVQAEKISDASPDAPTADGSSSSNLAYLLSSIQMRFNWMESRLEDSLKVIENRLEDKVSDLRATVNDRSRTLDHNMEDRFGTLDIKMNNLENRLEDKIADLHTRVVEALGQIRTASNDKQVASNLDGLKNQMKTNNEQLKACVAEVKKLTVNTGNVKENLSDQLATVITSVQYIEENLTCFDENLDKTMTTVDQWARTNSAKDTKLDGLVSSVDSLSELTLNLTSRVDSFREAYAGGALMPVKEFSDPLGTGTAEWRLAFRGTAYNNIQVYPAYMHGTGIPVEVEEGCKQFNKSFPCVNHYRNRDAFDNWTGLDEILFAIYKDNQMVKKVVFNGKGSTFTNWFAADRVILSSWVDLTTQPHNYFSLAGGEHINHFRRFFMSLDYDKGCDGFRGWFKATETQEGCPLEKNALAIPMFKYATGNTFALWQSNNAATADAFGIYLKYE